MNFTATNPARVILAVDYPGRPYHNIAGQVSTRMPALGDPFVFGVVIAKDCVNEEADAAVVFDWKDTERFAASNRVKRIVLCLYDHITWITTKENDHAFRFAYDRADGVAVANEQIADSLRYRGYISKPVWIVEDGVDVDLFCEQHMPPLFTVGWCGNSQAGHGDLKGLDLIQRACELAEVQLLVQDMATGQALQHTAMVGWYGQISCYVNASKTEGTPNPVLEAMACGRPVVSTRCGIVGRIVTNGVNGFFVERSIEAIAAALRRIKGSPILAMGSAARRAAEAHSWACKVGGWRAMLYGAASL